MTLAELRGILLHRDPSSSLPPDAGVIETRVLASSLHMLYDLGQVTRPL